MEIVGWSQIEFNEDANWKEQCEKILEDSKNFTSSKGYHFEEWFKDINPLLEKFGDRIVFQNEENIRLVFNSRFIKGTYIVK